MATTVNIHDAKTHFSKLIAAVEAGDEVIIARAGRPCARLMPIAATERRLGALAGRWPRLDVEFFEPLGPDELAEWDL
jgi:prevent-host-death family protein